MMDPISNFDQQAIDRLVDGELSIGQQRGLISELDASADGWRRVALAFMEANQLRTAVRATLADTHDGRAMEMMEPPAKVDLLVTIPTRPSLPQSLNPHDGLDRTGRAGWVAAIAASLVIGVSAGRIWQPESLDENGVKRLSVHESISPAATAQQAIVAENATPTKPDVPVWLVDPEMQQMRSLSVPVMSLSEMRNADWFAQPSLPPSVRQQIERHGYHIEERRTWLPCMLPDGREAVLPVDTFRIGSPEQIEYQ